MRIGIAGASGRMGRLLVQAVRDSPARLAGGMDPAGVPDDVPSFTDIADLAAASDVVIDFTRADTVSVHAAALSTAGTGWVLGTTGLAEPDWRAVEQAACTIAIVQAANFSPGVALVLDLAERMGRALGGGQYDAEIVEMHHRQKIDSPSGTALALGEAVAAGRGEAMQIRSSARHGTGEIGFAALRGGQIVGEHGLIFTSAQEQIGLSHRAFDRGVFAVGAVQAALWLQERPPGRYGMMNVLGLM